jgi:hypothetical protein
MASQHTLDNTIQRLLDSSAKMLRVLEDMVAETAFNDKLAAYKDWLENALQNVKTERACLLRAVADRSATAVGHSAGQFSAMYRYISDVPPLPSRLDNSLMQAASEVDDESAILYRAINPFDPETLKIAELALQNFKLTEN